MTTTPATLKSFEKKLGYSFKNGSLFLHALTHSSHKNEFLNGPQKGTKLDLIDNERLEFFGDAILSFVICKKLYSLFPDMHEGELSKYRSLLVSRRTLSLVARKLKLHPFLRLGKSEAQLKLKEKTKMLADTLEAIIAAVYLDGGIRAVEKVIHLHFSGYLDVKKLKRIDSNENYKSLLQEHTQRDFHLLPRYKTILEGNSFCSTIYFRNKSIGMGKGNSKREAEKEAAKEALRYYRKNLRPATTEKKESLNF